MRSVYSLGVWHGHILIQFCTGAAHCVGCVEEVEGVSKAPRVRCDGAHRACLLVMASWFAEDARLACICHDAKRGVCIGEAKNPGPPADSYIRHGRDIWEEFLDASCLRSAKCVALFDKHNVLDTLSHPSAVALATELQHGSVPFGICSFGLTHSHSGCVQARHLRG